MDIHDDLDSDFLFYLDFTKTFINQIRDKEEKEKCRAWLAKLCGEAFRTVDEKRNRNILLSQLVLCMEDGKLKPPFTEAPNAVDWVKITSTLGQTYQNEEEDDLVNKSIPPNDFTTANGDARTYLATRALPGGQGAFAYFAITLSDEEPKWIGAGEGLDRHMEKQFQEMVPPLNEMEQILLKRKDPEERKRVLAFYDTLLENIDSELDGNILPESNNIVNGLLEQLENDLRCKGAFDVYEDMDAEERRVELLTILHERLHARRLKVVKREQYLDSIEVSQVNQSFFENSAADEDKHILPSAMWEQVINREPNKKNMNLLYEIYPKSVIAKFVELLSNEKEIIALNRQKRHENIVTQMKKELRTEGINAKIPADRAKAQCDETLRILKLVKTAYDKQQAHKKEVENKTTKGGRTENSDTYDQMREALYETQKNVEEEAERGQFLAKQITDVNAQTEEAHKANEESIRRIEETNMKLMKTVTRLRKAVGQHETRLEQLKAQGEHIASSGAGRKGGQMFIM